MSVSERIVYPRCHLAEELIQILCLNILECNDNRYLEAYSGGYLKQFLCACLFRLWHNKDRKKKYKKSTTNDLFEHCDLAINIDELIDDNHDYDKKTIEKMIDIIKKDCDSSNQGIFYKSRVFNYSHNNIAELDAIGFNSAAEFSRNSKIPKTAVQQACIAYKKYLKKKLKND